MKKKPASAAARHADDWLMTYADMITLLLCFFAIFLSVSLPKKEAPVAPPKPQTVTPFRLPEVFEGNLPFHGVPVSDVRTEEEASFPPPPEKTQPAGDRLTTIDMDSAAFFDSGSATLSEPGKAILGGVAATLKDGKYKDYAATVEGHTDDSPIGTSQFPSNWELSTARAAAVVRFFIEQGIPADKLRAAGYADTFPKAPNRDALGNAIPENQAQNRRVVIKLEKIEKEKN